MGFYLRDEYLAEYERKEKQLTAAGRRFPTQMNQARGSRLIQKFSDRTDELSEAVNQVASLAGKELARYWRRTSSRVLGMVTNTIETFFSLATD